MKSNSPTFIASRSGKIAIILAIVILLSATGGYFYYTKVTQTSQNSRNSSFTNNSETETVARLGDLLVSASGTGTLISPSTATFGFATSGPVTQVNVKVGGEVAAGQVLAQVDDTLLQLKYNEAQQALQELYSASSIATAEKEVATAMDTEFQARTWLAYLISPDVVDAEENLASAQDKLTQAEAAAKADPSSTTAAQKVKDAQAVVIYLQQALNKAWVDYKNLYGPDTFTEHETVGRGRARHEVVVTYTDQYTGEVLPKIDWPSDADIATARSNYAQAKQTITDGQAYVEALKSGNIPENATGSQFSTLYTAQEAVNTAKANLDQAKLIAPVSGIVTAMDINLGDQANTSSAITISELSQPYTLDAYLDETGWTTAKIGNKATVKFDLLSDESFPATMTMVYPELDSSADSPLVHVQVQLDDAISQTLPVGTGATVSVIGGEAHGAIIVPVSAIHQTGNGGFAVYVMQNGQRVEQPVEIGLQGTSYVEIKSGLTAGDILAAK